MTAPRTEPHPSTSGGHSDDARVTHQRRDVTVECRNERLMDERSQRIARRLEPPLLLAALLTIPAIVIEGSTTDSDAQTVAAVLNWIIWLAFAVEVVVMLAVAPDRRAWMRGHLLELRLAEADARVAGFALLVPHYLGETEYPAAAIAGLDSLSVATGLVFDSDTLRNENRDYLEKVADQVSGSEELTTMLHTLEERYDSYMAGSALGQPIIHTGDLPSADELAAELERFLASRPPGDDDKRGRS